MKNDKEINVGIGFATGRKHFQKILRTNIHSWGESGLVDNCKVSLNLFVAYDLSYHKTKVTDYTNVNPALVEQIDSSNFIGNESIQKEIDYLIQEQVITLEDASLIFGKGYAAKRNAILYYAIKNEMDYLIFLDDDEYPLAVTNTANTAIWGGQHVLATHLKHIKDADITNGKHCGYISPIPYMKFNDTLAESDFRSFIEAISNDIITWDNVMKVMKNGGVTYADTKILTSNEAVEVQEINHAKFISGANLCINLTDPTRVFPFYNPPNARGEDTFLSTCLNERKVMRVPCYMFHDGFATYNHLLSGVLPTKLKFVEADTEQIIKRFYKACIGWIRYKPLLMHITQPDNYEENIAIMREQLKATLPKICDYFDQPDFMHVLDELDKYHRNVKKHHDTFKRTQKVWENIMSHFSQIKSEKKQIIK